MDIFAIECCFLSEKKKDSNSTPVQTLVFPKTICDKILLLLRGSFLEPKIVESEVVN